MTGAVQGPCDGGRAAAAREPEGEARHPGLALAASILASSTAFVDGSDVNVALPAIGADLGVGAAALQWVVNAYLLPLSGLLLLGGATGDKFGRRRLFLIGCLLFGLATILCWAAPTLELLLAGRALQGIGSALLMPNSLALIGAHFAGEARGRAIGTWAAAGAVAGAIGPLIGGWLVESYGWRAIFLLDLPLVAGALLLGWLFVEESREGGGAPIDWLGVTIATLGLGGVTWGLTAWSGGGSGAAPALLGVVALILFLLVERRRGEAAIMPLAMFGTASFAGLTLLTFFLYAALGGLFVLLPFVMIELNGFSPLEAGAALLPLPAVIGLASRAMGGLAARIGPRLPLTIGPLIVAAGFALLTRAGADGGYVSGVLPGLLVVAIGMAGAVAPLTTAEGVGRHRPCRHRQRFQQRGRPYRRADRDGAARRSAGGARRGARRGMGRRRLGGGRRRRGCRPRRAAAAPTCRDQDAGAHRLKRFPPHAAPAMSGWSKREAPPG